MTNSNDYEAALCWFKNYALPALENTPPDIGHAKVITTALAIAKDVADGKYVKVTPQKESEE